MTASGDVMDVTPERHPDLFAAGRVSLGALGVISQYTLKTVPSFNLHRKVWVEPIDDLIARAEALVVKSFTKLRSILIRSKGKRRR